MSGLRLLQDHLNSLESFLLVIELSANHIVEMLTVLSSLVSQIIEHLFGAEVLTSDFLGVHESLANG